MPTLMARIAAALNIAALPGRQKLELEVMARQISTAFKAIGEAPDAEASEEVLYAQLLDRTDRLRELITAANLVLDGLDKQH